MMRTSLFVSLAGCHVLAGLDGYDVADQLGGAAGVASISSANTGAAGGAPCSVPEGWTSMAPCAAEGAPFVLGLEVSPAGCSGCSCGPVDGSSCGVDLACWNGTPVDCGVSAGNVASDVSSALGGGMCEAFVIASDPFWTCKTVVGLEGAPSCAASGGLVEPADVFARSLALCDGCGCLVQSGERDCPDGFGARSVGYLDATDGRSCSACSCSPGVSCSPAAATAAIWGGSDCASGGNVLAGAACVQLPATSYQSALLTVAPALVGDCAPDGGEPSGAVEPIEPWTVCCEG
jgi:hypothetical protein